MQLQALIRKTIKYPSDSKLNFESHINSFWRKSGQKINALARLKNYLPSDQTNLLLILSIIRNGKSLRLLWLCFVMKSQFSYRPLTWMFTSRYRNNALITLMNELCDWSITTMRNHLIVSWQKKTVLKLFIKKILNLAQFSKVFKWLVSADHEWYFDLKTKNL